MDCPDCILSKLQASLRRMQLSKDDYSKLQALQAVFRGLSHKGGRAFYGDEQVPVFSNGMSTPCLMPDSDSELVRHITAHEDLLQHIARRVMPRVASKPPCIKMHILMQRRKTKQRVHSDNPGRHRRSAYWTVGLGPDHTTALSTDVGFVVPQRPDVLFAWDAEHAHFGSAVDSVFRVFIVVSRPSVVDANDAYVPVLEMPMRRRWSLPARRPAVAPEKLTSGTA